MARRNPPGNTPRTPRSGGRRKPPRNGRGLFLGAVLGAIAGYFLGRAAGNPIFGALLGAVVGSAILYRVNPGPWNKR